MDTLVNTLRRDFANNNNINRMYSQDEYVCLKKTYTERIISAINVLGKHPSVVKLLLTSNCYGIAFLAKSRSMLADIPELDIEDIETIYSNLVKLYTACKKIHELDWGLNTNINYQHSYLDAR